MPGRVGRLLVDCGALLPGPERLGRRALDRRDVGIGAAKAGRKYCREIFGVRENIQGEFFTRRIFRVGVWGYSPLLT